MPSTNATPINGLVRSPVIAATYGATGLMYNAKSNNNHKDASYAFSDEGVEPTMKSAGSVVAFHVHVGAKVAFFMGFLFTLLLQVGAYGGVRYYEACFARCFGGGEKCPNTAVGASSLLEVGSKEPSTAASDSGSSGSGGGCCPFSCPCCCGFCSGGSKDESSANAAVTPEAKQSTGA